VELDEWESAGVEALDTKLLPSPDSVATVLERESRARATYEEVSETRSRPEYLPLLGASAENRQALEDKLNALLGVAEQIGRHLHAWAERAVREIVGDHDRAWRELFEVTREHLSAIGARARWADETPVSGLGGHDHHEVRADAEAMLAHLADGGSWGLGPFRSAPAKRAQYLRREVRIAGHSVDSHEHLESLISWLDVENRIAILCERWASIHAIDPHSAFSAQVRDLEDLCEPLEAALGLHASKALICSDIHAISGLSEPIWHEPNSLRSLRDCAAAVLHELRFRAVQQELSQVQEQLLAALCTNAGDRSERDLIHSLELRDTGAYREAFARALHNEQLSARLEQREALLSELRHHATILAEQLAGSAHDESWDRLALQFRAAWNWSRAGAWIERLCNPEAEQQLRLQLDSARERIRNRLKEVAAEKAWTHCFSRMTEHERQHLVAWSKAMRSIGKGTGKYAAQHRRNAREHMNECRSAIPAWVMPIYRVAETIKPGKDLFDVVIVDEASQSGPEALLLAYLAKQLVVVGDDKQISPTYAGINFEDVNHLRARHLTGLPHADSYGVNQSFFDLAEIRYQGRIRLREHFRCMPEIIQFSNNLCYASEPLIPLRQYGSSRLSPVVSVHHVPDGYMKGSGPSFTNPPEAQAVVSEILRMHADRLYEGKTFGVISLLGQSQAREIEALLLKHLSPQEMHDLQLVCGDAYAFQGDERDVILLSLVSAPGDSRRIGTLADEASRRRFNVAVSRARDQIVLFHTATLNDLSPHCLRYALLQYCQNPTVDRLEYFGRPILELQHFAATANRERIPAPEPFESWFELDVFLRIAFRGYRVLPQHEVAGYRIDLVVDGMKRRVAVECDGDHWHGPDRYEEDMTRQRMLERSGWRFWRVRASAFSLDPDAALEGLWETLQREGVHPCGQEPAPTDLSTATDETRSAVPADPQSPIGPSFDIVPFEVQPSLNPESEADTTDCSGRDPDPTNLRTMRAERRLPQFMEVPDLGDAPYTAWTPLAQLPDPALSRPADLMLGLVEIVGVEGPLSADRLCALFVRGAGRQRVGRQLRSMLNKGIWKAIRDGFIEERNEASPSGPKERVLRKANSPRVVVRPRGNRDFLEIPPSEVATVMCRLERQGTAPHLEALCRAVLNFYEAKRMTKSVQTRLQWIYERRQDLADGGKPDSQTDVSWRLE
jgi:very-short-patch-repair endonuclease